jgi:excisionase family DNA binding protein
MEGLTIAQAAQSLGVSSRTVRRFIKSGKLNAELVPGPFGEEYRILELPAELYKSKHLDKPPVESPSQPHSQPPSQHPIQASIQTTIQSPIQSMDNIIRELHEKNINLAAQLGAATERIRNLEGQVRLLTGAKQEPWWKRLFVRKYYKES